MVRRDKDSNVGGRKNIVLSGTAKAYINETSYHRMNLDMLSVFLGDFQRWHHFRMSYFPRKKHNQIFHYYFVARRERGFTPVNFILHFSQNES
jgi:hypothetical protein